MSTVMKASQRAQVLLARGGDRVAALDTRATAHRVILRALPLALQQRFAPDTARGLDACFELRVRDPAGGEPTRFELRVAGSALTVKPGAAGSAGASVQVGADDMIRLVSGAVGWPDLLAAGRLELFGDPFLALRFPQLFRLPATAGA
jgi:hypothetical protein